MGTARDRGARTPAHLLLSGRRPVGIWGARIRHLATAGPDRRCGGKSNVRGWALFSARDRRPFWGGPVRLPRRSPRRVSVRLGPRASEANASLLVASHRPDPVAESIEIASTKSTVSR